MTHGASTFETLQELTVRFSLASNGEEFGHALMDVSKRFGFSAALVLDMSLSAGLDTPAVIYGTPGDALFGLADGADLTRHPFTRRARTSDRPFVVSAPPAGGAQSDEWWSHEPLDAGEMDGVVIPVHGSTGLDWLTCFGGRTPELSHRALSVISVAVHAAHARFLHLRSGGSPHPLTPREAQCLQLIAGGKTDREVGIILAISPRTVRFHIDNAKTKLGVATRIQAVTKHLNGTLGAA